MRLTSRFLPAALLMLAAFVHVPAAHAQDGGTTSDPIRRPDFALLHRSLAARSSALSTTAAADTQWVGHSHTDHTAGGANPRNIYVGTMRPGRALANDAEWDFDDQTGLGADAASGDSLQGWWPVRTGYRYSPLSAATDDQRPWYCLDFGNQLSARPVNPAHPRTFGVVSAWHADPGNAAGHVMWAPLSGAHSMWCGLRELNDMTVIDPVTHQPFNEQAVMFNTVGGVTAASPTYRAYPGYGNMWDQMLYRDFALSSGASLHLQFLYRTRMSTSFVAASSSRTGWFHGDPFALTPGNFISSNAAGANAPRDSFSVYIGVPVDDQACVYSDPSISPAPVFDRQRRWFNEVLRLDSPRYEVLGQAGANPADTLAPSVSVDQTIPWADPGNGNAFVQAIYADAHNAAHLVRLVFRVKTNRLSSDDDYKGGNGALFSGFTSNGRGAVLLDDVSVNGALSDFEGVNGGVDDAVDGTGAWVTPPTAAWKTTGKPVPTYMHPVDVITDLHWSDLCGPPHTANSQCDLDGIVAAVGNADQGEAIADGRWPSQQEAIYGMMSPTIDLVTPGSGPNEMGLTSAITQGTTDILLAYELNYAAFNLVVSGALQNWGAQSYPVIDANGHKTWSDVIQTYRNYWTSAGCVWGTVPLGSWGYIQTSNANGVPDSLRIYLGVTTECFYFGFGPCNQPIGGYFDDIALVFLHNLGTDAVGPVSSDIWQWFSDAFPVNGFLTDNVAAGTAAFDTTTAYVKGPLNLAPNTGDATRADVLADTIVVDAPNGAGGTAPIRVDLVFRILPGPGNYRVKPGRTFPPTAPPSAGGDPTTGMELLQSPSDPMHVVTPGDASFWGQYLQTPGAYASPGAHHGGTWWDYLSWNSARCDTAETNEFPVAGVVQPTDLNGEHWQSTYHESDPHYATLGIARARCFLINPAGPVNSTNTSCDAAWNAANLAWPHGAGTGFDGAWTTVEGTKIIPDGLLTPGSHVQYFFRKSRIDGVGGYAMDPDTTNISPQLGEYDFDGHRFEDFGVLPDRWKDTSFGGQGMACMLTIDDDTRYGDGRVWVSIADSIGLTSPSKWGAHNGWHAAGAGFDLYGPDNPSIAEAYVHERNQQPGTVWDLYRVRGAELGELVGGQPGNRYAPAPTGLLAAKAAATGPRKPWLRNYYRSIVWLTGHNTDNSFGPEANLGADDIGLFEDFLGTAGGTPQPRGMLVQGSGFAQQCANDGGVALNFLQNWLFTDFRDASYSDLVPALTTIPDLVGGTPLLPASTIYSVTNDCGASNNVLTAAPSEASVGATYQSVGVNGPYVAAVEHVQTPAHNWRSAVLGWDLQDTFSRNGATSNGRLDFTYQLLTNLFGPIACGPLVPPGGGVAGPPAAATHVDYLRVGGSVMHANDAIVHFGAAKSGRVRVRLFDVAGRGVRTLVDRDVTPGEYDARWDGRDDAGVAVRRGVYFARIEFDADGASRLGRMVVLR